MLALWRARALCRPVRLFLTVTLCLAAASNVASASFIGQFTATNFLLTNSNSDGLVSSDPGGAWVVITGCNNGIGDPGITSFTLPSPLFGVWSFRYVYESPD